MTDDAMTVLEGRLDGIGFTLLHLVAELEKEKLIDGPGFAARLRQWGQSRRRDAPHYWTSGAVVEEIADRLDEARARRSEASCSECR